jgi:DNA (cytosine-5)-methyltransferase 1
MTTNHAELFAGIGGFSLAARWMGWKNIFQVEIDSWCRKQLRNNFKETIIYGDIKKFSGERYKGKIDVLSGGFPCQPFSLSGDMQGTDDDRYLWPEMLRVCREIRPRFVVAENVPGLLVMEIDHVLDGLESEGYTCWPPLVVPAGAVGADHLRERVWMVAHSGGHRCKTVRDGSPKNSRKPHLQLPAQCGPQIDTADKFEKRYNEPILLTDKDGLPASLDCRNILKASGNAIVPQLAFEIFTHIQTFLN